MYSWGCEYLDLESFKEPIYKQSLHLPIDFVKKILDKEYISRIRIKDSEYITSLRIDIAQNGLKEELKITLGSNGLVLSDGNHRYCAIEELGYQEVPVKMYTSQNVIKKGGTSYSRIIEELMLNYGNIKRN